MAASDRAELAIPRRYRLDWADQEQREIVMQRLHDLKRQTMNLRIMRSVKLLVITAEGRDAPIGFCGVDDEYLPGYPEMFSLHLDSEYRSHQLGLWLETARAAYLLSRGNHIAYTRMSAGENPVLLAYRLGTQIFTRVPQHAVAEGYSQLCQQCELFSRQCPEQAYLIVDIKALYLRGASRLGTLDIKSLPIVIEIPAPVSG